MKLILLFILTLSVQQLSAQIFTEVLDTPFEGAKFSAMAFADIDGDNDPDVLITGENNSDDVFAKLYTNDGGVFTEIMDTPFMGSGAGAIAFADIDGDNDPDVLITGDNESGGAFAKLYINDDGNFTEELNTPIRGGEGGTIDFFDIDGDNDLDLLTTGEGPWTNLYTNDGGQFTEVIDHPFDDIYFGSTAIADIDGNGDPDILISGLKSGQDIISKLYTNEGGIFTEVTGTPFDAVGLFCSVAFSDVDGDGDPDLLITGESEDAFISKLYTNESGNFTEVEGTPFGGLTYSSVVFSDIDGDNDPDLLISGLDIDTTFSVKLYKNEGGNFTEIMNTPFEAIAIGAIAFADVDGDNDPDVLITGLNSSEEGISKLYTNESVVSVEEESEDLSFDFMLFPNPTPSDRINITYTSNKSGSLIVDIYDIYGRLVKQQKERVITGEQTFSVDIGLLSKGNYTIQLDDGKRKSTRNLVVQ